MDGTDIIRVQKLIVSQSNFLSDVIAFLVYTGIMMAVIEIMMAVRIWLGLLLYDIYLYLLEKVKDLIKDPTNFRLLTHRTILYTSHSHHEHTSQEIRKEEVW